MAKIVIVEDHQVLRDIYHKKFASAGYQVVTAANKHDGLEAISRTKPDLVLLDLQLPDGNGIEVLKTLRADQKFKDLPVFISSNIEWWADEAAEAGATAVVSKTTHGPGELLRMADKLITPSPRTKDDDLTIIDLKPGSSIDRKKPSNSHRFAIYAEKFDAHNLEDSDWRFIESTFQTQVDRYKRYKIERDDALAMDKMENHGIQKKNGKPTPVPALRSGHR